MQQLSRCACTFSHLQSKNKYNYLKNRSALALCLCKKATQVAVFFLTQVQIVGVLRNKTFSLSKVLSG